MSGIRKVSLFSVISVIRSGIADGFLFRNVSEAYSGIVPVSLDPRLLEQILLYEYGYAEVYRSSPDDPFINRLPDHRLHDLSDIITDVLPHSS